MTPSDQIAYFEKMLEICDKYGWSHLAELIFQQYIKLQSEIIDAKI